MELLRLEHQDFVMTIECTKFDAIWRKAKGNVGEEHLTSTYSWSEGVVSVDRFLEDGKSSESILKDMPAPAVFFDNTDYPTWIDFKESSHVKGARFCSVSQSDNERFAFRRGLLAGFLNYGNEIGRSEINFEYDTDKGKRRFSFSFEVLSTKLDYHSHWKKIVEDIEQEYRMLSLDFLKRTFHSFSPDANGETPEIIWWSIFAAEQKKFLNASKNIIERPRHRLHGREAFLRADKLRRIPMSLENEIAEHRREPARLYRVEEQVQSNDTQENRFLKYALAQITDRYAVLKERILKVEGVSDTTRKELDDTFLALYRLRRNPFFRTIGRFKGLNQESLVLQKASGYSLVYRTWNLLRKAYSLNEGMYRLQSKDIATLYEIWCFIEVSHIVKQQLHLDDNDVEHRNRMEMNGLFTWELGKGENSRILFRKDGVELAELVYNPKNTERVNDNIGMTHLIVPTVPQKPDIVLQLTKNDLQKDMKMTYLFDAKYRIASKLGNGVDVPPDDAINQMHRYRDAIYYRDYVEAPLKKEVIGGYILFPGDGEPADVEVSKFYQTIKEVNIGAFPLRPNDNENRKLLEGFIRELIETKAKDTVQHVIPQKGTVMEVDNRVLVGVVRPSHRRGYEKSFLNQSATLYYTGAKFPSTIALQDLHYFVPYIKGKGIRDVYEIVRMRTITGKEAKQDEGADATDDLRLAFELRFSRQLYKEYCMIDVLQMKDLTFLDTTFSDIDGYVSSRM